MRVIQKIKQKTSTAKSTLSHSPRLGRAAAYVRYHVQRYIWWKHSWKTSSAALVVFFVAILFGWNVLHTSAATATMVPDGDTTAGWVTLGTTDNSCAGGTHCDFVDDGTTDNTADAVEVLSTNATASVTDQYTLNSPTSIASATQIVVRIYMEALTASNGGTMDTISLNLLINGTAQTATTCTPTQNTWTACTATYTGSWTQSDVDNMQVQIVRNILGSGKASSQPDTVVVSNVYGTLTYTVAYQYNQSAYRWFSNQDTTTPPAFARSWGGTGSDYGYSLVKTSDGGYAVTGQTLSYGDTTNGDMFLTKYDSGGNVTWTQTWGGTGADVGNGLVQTSDGGYAVTGQTKSYGDTTNGDMFLAKYDSTGTLSWSKTWGGTGADVGNGIVQTSDGGYAIAGSTASFGAGGNDMFLAKYDSTGTLSWSKTWGGTGADYGYSLVKTSDGGYAVTGQTLSYGDTTNGDMFLAKYDSTGTLTWSKTWGGTGADRGNSLVQTSDGGYAVAGNSSSTNPGAFLAKYDSTGTLSWNKTWGNTSNATANSIVQTSDGGYALAGLILDIVGGLSGQHIFLIKYDSTGTLSWQTGLNTTNSSYGGNGLTQTSDGGYALTGYTGQFSYDVLLIRYDATGTISGCGSLCYAPGKTVATPTATVTSPTATTTSPSTTSTILVGLTPAIDVGSYMAAQDTVATAPSEGTIFRLRLDLHVTGATLPGNGAQFKLRYALKGAAATCSVVAAGNYSDVTTSSTIRYADNTNAANGQLLTANANDPVHGTDTNVVQTYQETGGSIFSNSSSIGAGQDGMWDFGLVAYHALQGDRYCFKVTDSAGTDLNTYTVYPELIIPNATFSQASYRWYNPDPSGGSVTFAKAYGTSNSDQGSTVVNTSDGGFATVSSTDTGSSAFYLLLSKYDSKGNLSWSSLWGGSGTTSAQGLAQTSDGGYIVTGYTTAFGKGGQDIILVKFDSVGSLSWSRTLGGTNNDRSYSVIQTSSGGYAITGLYDAACTFSCTTGTMFIATFDSTGTQLWFKAWGNTTALSWGRDVVQTSDGGYAVTGYTTSYGAGADDMILVKYDSTGTVSWNTTWGGTGNDEGYSLLQASDGGYAVTGTTTNYGAGGNDLFLAKYNSTGTLSWSRTVGGTGNETGYDIIQTSDGGYGIAGTTTGYGGGNNDVYLAKYDSTGTLSWNRTWGGSTNDIGFSITQTSDGGYAMFGYTGSYGAGGLDALLLKYDSSGNIANCGTICTSPASSTSSPAASTSSPVASLPSYIPSGTSPVVTITNPTPTTTVIIANAVSVGNPFAPLNQPLDLSSLTPLNLRVAIRVDTSGIAVSGQSFKLQYAIRSNETSCSAVSASLYTDVTTSTPIQYYDDSRYASGQQILGNANDPSDGSRTMVLQSYQETNSFSNGANIVYAGQDGIWQFSLAINSSQLKGKNYCMRVALASDSTPSLTALYVPDVAYAPQMYQLMHSGHWFNRQGIRQNLVL